MSAPVSKIAEVEAIPLRAPAVDPTDLDGSRETVVVRITDEDGRAGIGEADAPVEAVRSLVLMDDLFAWSRGLRSALLGADPFELAALNRRLYQETIYHGRRGLGIHALSAVDIALHDLVGQQLGRPVYQLLGGARREAITPYATIWPGGVKGRGIDELMEAIGAQFHRALELGYRAVKMEVVFGELVTDAELVECILEGRRLLGPEITLGLDFGYRWSDWRSALWVLDRVEDCDVYFAEAALQHDDLEGHRKLVRACRDPRRRRRARRDGARMPRMARARPGRRPPAGREPLRRSDGAPADRRARLTPRRARDPARLEDRDHSSGREALSGRDGERTVRRGALTRPLRVAATRRARTAGAEARQRANSAADRARARRRTRGGRRREVPGRLNPLRR